MLTMAWVTARGRRKPIVALACAFSAALLAATCVCCRLQPPLCKAGAMEMPPEVGPSRENFGPQHCLDDLVRFTRAAEEVLSSQTTSHELRQIVRYHLAWHLRETAALMERYGWSEGHDVRAACSRLTTALERTKRVLQDGTASPQSRQAARAEAYMEVLCLAGYIGQLNDGFTSVESIPGMP